MGVRSANEVFHRRDLPRDHQANTEDLEELFLTEGPYSPHRRAMETAIAAYDDLLRSGHSDAQACRGALLAYQKLCPNDANASDAVVDAILIAKEKWVRAEW